MIVNDDCRHAAGAFAVFKAVGVGPDGYIGQRFCRAVLHFVALVEGTGICQQRHERDGTACAGVRNCTKCAAADGDGSAVITEVYIAERTACDVHDSAYILHNSLTGDLTALDI